MNDVMDKKRDEGALLPFGGGLGYALGIAYEGVLDQIRFCMQRRINLATAIPDQTKKVAGVWLVAFGAAKGLSPDYKTAIDILEVLFLWIPVFGMLETLVFMGAARGVYQDEVNYIVQALKYEAEQTGGFGFGNTRYHEIVNGSYWKPATTEVAGIVAFIFWATVSLISRYFSLQ